jgi:hypothetical protein
MLNAKYDDRPVVGWFLREAVTAGSGLVNRPEIQAAV